MLELLRYISREYWADSQLHKLIGKLIGIADDEIEEVKSYFKDGKVEVRSQRACVRLLNVLLRRFGVRPYVVIRGDIATNPESLTCTIISPESSPEDPSLISLYEDLKDLFLEILSAVRIILPRSFVAEDGSARTWRFDAENYVTRILGFIREKLLETIISKGYIVIAGDPSFPDRMFKEIDLCREVEIVLSPDAIKYEVIYLDLRRLIESTSFYRRCYLTIDVDRKLLKETLFSLFFNLTIEELKRGLRKGVKVGRKLELLGSITEVKDVIDVKPFVEEIERRVEDQRFDFTKVLEEHLSVERELPKRIIRGDSVNKFLQHQAVGKKPINEANLIVYLLLHAFISKVLLYRLLLEPESISGYFMMYYKHLTDVLYDTLSRLLQAQRKSLESVDLELTNTAKALKQILDYIQDYLNLVIAASRHVNLLSAILLGGVKERERLISVERVEKGERELIGVTVSGSKGRFYFALCRRPQELMLSMVELELKGGGHMKRGLIVSSGIKDRDTLRERLGSIREDLRSLPLTGSINVMPVEEEFWALTF